MNNKIRGELHRIVHSQSADNFVNIEKLSAIIAKEFPQDPLERNGLLLALEGTDLLSLRQSASEEPMITRLVRCAERLYREKGLRNDLAHWAVESWALALDIIAEPFAQDRNEVVIVREGPPTNPNSATLRLFRDQLKDGRQAPEMVILPTGSFRMGGAAQNQQPVHEIHVANAVAIGRYPVTFADYDLYCAAKNIPLAADYGWGRGARPAIHVSWQDAMNYCDWLAVQTGREYRLPSEAMWEYACRAGTEAEYFFSGPDSNLNRYAWFSENSGGTTQPVGELLPNPWGLHDMLGNIWEWCEDSWHDSYQDAPVDGSAWTTGGLADRRVLRGGAWWFTANYCRPAYRDWIASSAHRNTVGFRICCTMP